MRLDPLGHERCGIEVDRPDQPSPLPAPATEVEGGLQIGPDQRLDEIGQRYPLTGPNGWTGALVHGAPMTLLGPVQQLQAAGVERSQDPVEHRPGQSRPTAEVVVDRARVGAGGPHDGAQRRPLEPVDREALLRCVDQGGCRRSLIDATILARPSVR